MAWFIFIVLSIIFIFSPYEQGLYFDTDFYSYQLLILVLFSFLFIRLVLYKEWNTLANFSFIFIIPLCYFIATFYAVSPQGAWDSFLRSTTYCAFFLLLIWSTKKEKINKLLPIIFQVTGIWIAIYMILVNFDLLHYPKSFIDERFSGFFQYPNTFGMTMVVFYLFSLIMLTKDNLNKYLYILYTSPLVLYFFCFIASYSRGMYLIFPIVWFIGLLLLKPSKQMKYCFYTIISSFATLFIYNFVDIGTSSNDITGLFVLIFASLIVVIIFTMYEYFSNKNKKFSDLINQANKKRIFRFIVPIAIIIATLFGVLDIVNKGYVYQQLPLSIQERFNEISNSSTARERILFFEDAIEISKESPIIGQGGGTWETLFRNYQQLPYQSIKVHNGFLEWILDIGWLGFTITISILGFFYFLVFKRYYYDEDKVIPIAVIVTTLTIFLHSFIDFNLSFGTVCFLLFWLFAMGIVLPEKRTDIIYPLPFRQALIKVGPYLLSLFTVLVAVSLIFSYRFNIAEQSYNKARASTTIVDRLEYLENAVSKNPYNIDYMLVLSENYLFLSKQNNAYYDKGVKLINEATQVESLNSYVYYKAASIFEKMENNEEALKYYEKVLSFDKYNLDAYLNGIKLSLLISKNINESNFSTSKEYLQLGSTLYEKYVKVLSDFEKNPISSYHNSRDFGDIPVIHNYGKEINFLKEKLKETN